MSFKYDQLQVTPPDDFELEECMLSYSLRLDALPDVPESAINRPNLVVHRKRSPENKSLTEVGDAIALQLKMSLPGFELISREELHFDDGRPGLLMSYRFAAREQGDIQQMQAIRLDGEITTMATLTLTARGLSGKQRKQYKKSLCSVILR